MKPTRESWRPKSQAEPLFQAAMSLLEADLARNAVPTVGDSSALRLKHYKALQINRADLRQRREENSSGNFPFQLEEDGAAEVAGRE